MRRLSHQSLCAGTEINLKVDHVHILILKNMASNLYHISAAEPMPQVIKSSIQN